MYSVFGSIQKTYHFELQRSVVKAYITQVDIKSLLQLYVTRPWSHQQLGLTLMYIETCYLAFIVTFLAIFALQMHQEYMK